MGTKRIRHASLALVVLFTCLSPLFASSAGADELDLRLKGVSMSRHGPMALIDHRVVEPGDTIGDVEIREIRKFSVIVRSRGQDYVLRLGSDGRPQPYVAAAPAPADPIPPVAAPEAIAAARPTVAPVAAATPAVADPVAEPALPAAPAPTIDAESSAAVDLALGDSPESPPSEDRIVRETVPSSSAPTPTPTPPERARFHRVALGETLSGIVADHYGATSPLAKRAMVVLYDAHPEAFGADMNVLFEGARLQMPDENRLNAIDADAATAEVERHLARWRLRTEVPELAEVERSSDARFLPVVVGETLSAIAARERLADVTLEQMMLVVFDANPHAFGGNINLLFAGETLRIPPTGSTDAPSPERAAAEVRRQMALWQEREAPIETAPEATPFAALSLSSY